MAEETSNDAAADVADAEVRRVERPFTCTACGFATTVECGELTAAVRGTCLNCGDWTVQTAATGTVVAAARDAAERLAGDVLTERQALAFLLRDRVGVERGAAAEAMGTTPSNVDNLQRRGREKVAEARRVVDELAALSADGRDGAGEEGDATSDDGASTGNDDEKAASSSD